MPIGRALAFALALAIACADVAIAEIYRWTDEGGRERFVSSLDQVPPRYRAAARERASKGRGSVSYHRDRSPSPRAEPAPTPAEQPPAATATQPDAPACKAIRRQIAKKEKVIRTHERSVESNERKADDITRSAFSRRKYEVRAEEEAGWLAKAEADLETFREARRREGASPGCLR